MKVPGYSGKIFNYRLLIMLVRRSLILKVLLLLLFACTLSEFQVAAQEVKIDQNKDPPFVYDETPVRVMVQGYGDFYLYILYSDHDLLYVNIEDLFKSLKIPCIIGQKGDSIGGFLDNESRTYTIDYPERLLKVGDKTVHAQNGLRKEMGSLYLESSLFAEAFGINLAFSYRSLTIQLKSDFELPAVKQLRIENLRGNVSKIKGEEFADTIVRRNYHFFRPGMFDWSVLSVQTWNGSTDIRLRAAIGTEFLYGEADISIDYYNQQKFDNRQLQYLWRWVDNDKKIVKQAQVGNLSMQTIAFINSPVIGATIRNSPTTVRKASGYYTINEFTEPNWTVELYINNVLVGYTKADASGLYIFKVPIVYGYTTLKFRFYGPMGEERTEERTVNVPYTIMAPKEFEYGLSAGIVLDSTSSRFGKAELNYGVNRFLTIGGGMEYLSSVTTGAFIPYAKATFQPFRKLTINGEYAYGVRGRGLLEFYFWRDALLEIDYACYTKGQLATRFNANEERKVKLSVPFRVKKITGYVKIDYQQLVYNDFYFNQGNVILSMYYKQLNVNAATHLNWIDQKTPYITTDLALSYRLKRGYTLSASAQYDASAGHIMSVRSKIEKRISKAYFSFSYERNLLFNENFITFNFTYDLPFARTNISATYSGGKVAVSEGAQGSLAYTGDNHIHASNNSSVGRGGISLYPFLDFNNNGVFDAGEQMVKLNSVTVFGGRAIFSKKDSILRIADLNAFINYIVAFDDNDLENIAWRFRHKTYQVLIDPNQFKRVDVPIMVVGEASGTVYMNSDKGLKGIGRILVKFYKKNSNKIVTETLSESDGYIDYLGLEPGDYTARIDSAQLSNLGFTAEPPQRSFAIKTLKEGDIVGGVDFVLNDQDIEQVVEVDPLSSIAIQMDKNVIVPGTASIILKYKLPMHEKNEDTYVWGPICRNPGGYYVQCGAFRYKNNAMKYASMIKIMTAATVSIELIDGLYKVRAGCFTTRSEAAEVKSRLKEQGVYDEPFLQRWD